MRLIARILGTALLLLYAVGGFAQTAVVLQQAPSSGDGVFVATLPSHTAGGMSCVKYWDNGGTPPPDPTNTAGFVWTSPLGYANGKEIWCAPKTAYGSADTVTVASSAYHGQIIFADYSLVTASDGSATDTGNGTTPLVSFAISGSNDIVIALCSTGNGDGVPGAGYTAFTGFGTGYFIAEYGTTSTGPAVATCTQGYASWSIYALALSAPGGTPTAATPTFSPAAGTYSSTQSVAISTSTSGATICYTSDGSTPTADGAGTCTHGTTYTTAVSVATTLTLKAIASKSGYTDSGVASALYTITAPSIVMTPNVPTYNFQVLPGSTRQISTQIGNGSATPCGPGTTPSCVGTVDWSVVSGSATFTDPTHTAVSSITGGLATILVNIGATTGSCSITGSAIGTYGVTSTTTATVRATSTDDPTQHADFLFNVCAQTTTVIVAPAYQQAFQGQKMTLQSWVTGDTDETGTWSILTQPGGGDGALADTGNRDAQFSATVTGRYVIKYTSHSDASKNATGIVYVSPNPLPSYAVTPQGTQPRECYVDPALTGGDYEVGPGQAYTTIQSTPAANTLAAGSIIRIHPGTYAEYYQIHNSGTATQPMIVCGVADTDGTLPVVTGNNATGQAGTSIYAAAGWGVLSLWAGGYGSGTPYGYWQAGSAGPSYVSITGLHVMDATPAFTYTQPGGVAAGCQGSGPSLTTCNYIVGASAINLRGGSYIDIAGVEMDTATNGIFTATNTNNGWANVTQEVTVSGSHITNSGWATDYTEHQAYLQSFYMLFEGNLVDNYLSTAAGSEIKWRGLEGIFRYNNLGTGPQRDFDLVENQDGGTYMNFEWYLSNPGQTNCAQSLYCLGDTAGANIVAGYQESQQKDFVYGNAIFGASAVYQIHYAEDHDSGMSDRNGTLYFYSNTLDNAQVVFDQGSGGGYNPILTQRFDARNNILWPSGTVPGVAFNRNEMIILNPTTNLMRTSSFSITTPITGGSYSGHTANGWNAGCDYTCFWPLTNPINPHLYGLTNANYLSTATQPYDGTTLIPPGGSAAIGAGTPLSGVLATMPVRWQWNVATGSLTPRLYPLTIGAEDQAGSTPTAATPTFSPVAGTYTGTQSVTTSTSTSACSAYLYTGTTNPPTVNTNTISVAASETVYSYVHSCPGYLDSAIASAAYTITAPSSPQLTIGGHGVTINRGCVMTVTCP